MSTKVAMAAAVAALLLVPMALAEPPPGAIAGSPLSQWFQGLTQPETGGSCCSMADCRAIKARINSTGHYEVWHEGAWLLVPDKVILPAQHNPVGETVACIMFGRVLCLVRGPET